MMIRPFPPFPLYQDDESRSKDEIEVHCHAMSLGENRQDTRAEGSSTTEAQPGGPTSNLEPGTPGSIIPANRPRGARNPLDPW